MGNEGISEERFFDIWKEVCKEKKADLVKAWEDWKKYSDVVLGHGNSESVVCGIKNGLTEYELQQEYYSCDVVYYSDKDFIKQNPLSRYNKKSTRDINCVWLKTIRIHLEHENDIKNSWQEITQLCVIPGRELNVLVTYPSGKDDSKKIINAYKSILSENDSCKGDFFHLLIIFGFLNDQKDDIEWKGWKWNGTKLNEIKGEQ